MNQATRFCMQCNNTVFTVRPLLSCTRAFAWKKPIVLQLQDEFTNKTCIRHK